MDQDDALPKLDEIAEGKGESPGELSDAGERLDSVRDSTSALLLLFKPSEQLRRQQQLRKLLVTSCVWENQSWMFAFSFFVTSQTNTTTLQITENVQEQKLTTPKTTAREKCVPHNGSAPGH